MGLFKKSITILANLDKTRPVLYFSGLVKNLRECIIGTWHYACLFFSVYSDEHKSVLLVEFNPFHGETLPGYVHYFQELGYEVTVITRHATYADSPFVRMETKPRHFCLTIWGMRHFLKSAKIKDFDFIFYNSAHLYLEEYRFYGRVADFLGGKVIGGKKGFALVEHSLKPGVDLEYFHNMPDDASAKQDLFQHSFVLTEQNVEGHVIPMLNPCFFGEVKREHKLNAKRIFLTIGNVSSNSRNFTQFFETLKLLGGEYEVWIIGRVLEETLVKAIPSNVRVLGRLSFAEMYNRLEQADFFLPLLDPKTQSLYLQGCTSGSRQLILGFNIPPLIHEAFAVHYDFSQDSCLTYKEGQTFVAAMATALKMDDDDYGRMKSSLGKIAEEVHRISLDNLRKMMDI